MVDFYNTEKKKEDANDRRARTRQARQEKLQTENLRKAETEKRALDEIQSERFIETARSYYNYREGTEEYNDYSSADILEKFYEDRTWGNYNTFAMGADVVSTSTEEDNDRLKQFAYLQQTFEALPSFWNDPNRTFGEWLVDAGGAMIADPINLIGAGVGGVASKEAFKLALKEQLKGKMAKEITDKQIKEAAKQAQKEALGKAAKTGAAIEGSISAFAGGTHDTLLQVNAINTGVQDEFSFKQMGVAAGVSSVFGSAFGAGTSAFSFKLTSKQMQNTAVKQLKDLHDYGVDTTTGRTLFKDLTEVKQSPMLYKNKPKKAKDDPSFSKIEMDTDNPTFIKNLRDIPLGRGKPPYKDFNYDRMDDPKNAQLLDKIIQETALELKSPKVSLKQMREIAEEMGLDPEEIMRRGEDLASQKDMFAVVIAHGNLIQRQLYEVQMLSNRLNRPDLSAADRKQLVEESVKRLSLVRSLAKKQKEIQENPARATTAGRVTRTAMEAADLKADPQDPVMKRLLEDDPEEFLKRIALLDDDKQIIMALDNVKNFKKLDLAAEYVNNNLLSSPDTHILNIMSGMTQYIHKPFVMAFKAANLAKHDRERAQAVFREAYNTLAMQFAYTGHALSRAKAAFIQGRPLLDRQQLKVDSNIRQGQLQRWLNASAELITTPLGRTGALMQKYLVEPTTYAVTTPLRTLGAGDEFLKQMLFKGRMAANIHENIVAKHPELVSNKWNAFKQSKEYKAKFKEYEKIYTDSTGEAKRLEDFTPEDKAQLRPEDLKAYNTPLRYAQEGSYTQHYDIKDAITGGSAPVNITKGIMNFTGEFPLLRVLGMHFINTPSNLIRWNMQHLPFLGRFQIEMRQLLRTKDGGTLNFDPRKGGLAMTDLSKAVDPEAAAEAIGRIQMGYVIWTAGIYAALTGKVTGGGDRDYRVNKERTKATGWQPYSYRRDDGGYVSFNRLDPLFMPFGIAADMIDWYEMQQRHNSQVLPKGYEDKGNEVMLTAIASVVRNLTSKFYTTNIIDTAHFFLSDEAMRMQSAERTAGSIMARAIYKATPLSGFLRYNNRVWDDEAKELTSFVDRMKRLDPTGADGVMPERNMFGEKVKRPKGWFLGMKLVSSPFAWTEFENPAVADFFRNREFNYTRPPTKVPLTQLDLRDLKNKNGQSAYDYMMEQVGETRWRYKKKKNLTLRQYIEELIMDKNSYIYSLPSPEYTLLKDYQQREILKIIDSAEKQAWAKTRRAFPEIDETVLRGKMFDAEGFVKYKADREKVLQNILDY